jgi:hypothetical protein
MKVIGALSHIGMLFLFEGIRRELSLASLIRACGRTPVHFRLGSMVTAVESLNVDPCNLRAPLHALWPDDCRARVPPQNPCVR